MRFIRDLDKQHLKPLFSFSEWRGGFHRVEGKLTRLCYPVKCTLCGAEYNAYRTHDGVTLCQCQRTDHVYRSHRERDMEEWLRGLGFNVVACDRTILKGQELDLYLPDEKIAFEFNGMFFHSSSPLNPHPKPRLYHRDKTRAALAAGIRLYHFWEDTPDELVKSIILSKLGMPKHRFGAREFKVRIVPQLDATMFFDRCHVDGAARTSAITFGLYGEDSEAPVCCLSLMQRRVQATGTYTWEIGRFACELFYSIPGGYSRLLKHAIEWLRGMGCTELVSYCNRDLSPDPEATFYAKQGFHYEGDSGSIYWYWAQRPVQIGTRSWVGRIPRQAVQKSKLLRVVPHPEPPCTEQSLAAQLGIVPVFNSGNFKYTLKL